MINIEDAEQSKQQNSAKSWRAMFDSGDLQISDEIINFFQRQAPKFIAISTEEAGKNLFLNFNYLSNFCPWYLSMSIFKQIIEKITGKICNY